MCAKLLFEHMRATTSSYNAIRSHECPSHVSVIDEQIVQVVPTKVCAGFLDDILIYSKDPTTHEQHLEIVFEVSASHQLSANANVRAISD